MFASMLPIISIAKLSKTYASGFQALKGIDLEIRRGEIFALLGPNGAGKTTLISIVCGIVKPSVGSVRIDGHDIVTDYRAARSLIGLVPQELTTDAFETPWATVSFSRGLFGKAPDPAHIEKVLRDLSLWDKKDARIMTRRFMPPDRVTILASFLSHSDRSFSTFSIWPGLGALPNSPRLNDTVAHGVSKASVVSSCGTRPISDRAAR